MREIKFRAWDKEKNQMIPDFDNWIDFYGNYWCPPDKVFNTPNQEIYTPVNQPILMQYIGLRDNNNGKDIYEGDICKCKRNDGHTFIGKIIYDTDIASFVVIQNGYTENIYAIEYFEIIGNIYENPFQ